METKSDSKNEPVLELKDREYFARACEYARNNMEFKQLDNIRQAECKRFSGCCGWGITEQEAQEDFLVVLDAWLSLEDLLPSLD